MKRKIVAETLKKGKHYTNRRTLSLVVSREKSRRKSEIVIAVKKKLGASVVRNRIRRRVCAAVSKIQPSIDKEAFLVIFPMIATKNCKFSVLQENLVSIFKEAELLKG